MDWLPLVRFAHLTAAILLFGELVLAVVVLPPALRADAYGNALAWGRLHRRLRWIGACALAICVVSAALWFALQAANASGMPLGDALSSDTLARVATETTFGRAWMWRFVVAIALGVLLIVEARAAVSRRRAISIAAMVVAGLYLATLAFAGHAAAGQGVDRYVRVGSDAAHLVAAGAWLGALPGLVLLLRGARRAAGAVSIEVAALAVHRFSSLGSASVGVLVASGLVNAWFLVGDVPRLLGTEYGRLLTIKVALFVAMLALAAANRIRLSPRLDSRDFVALRALSRNAALETALGIVVVGIVGALGVTVPAAHQAIVWPLAFTLRFEPVAQPAAAGWIVAIFVTVACAAGALALAPRQRGRSTAWRIATASGVVLIAAALTCPYFSAVPADPTTYATSPVRYTTSAIAQGAALFSENCAACHGAHGRGDGPLAPSLANQPPDLVLHSPHHLAGDMYWWIAHGIAGTAMPPFGTKLDDGSIWSLIQFLRAQAAAHEAIALTSSVEPWRPIVAPDFTFERASRGQESLKDGRERENVLLVLYSLPQSRDRVRALALDEQRFAQAATRVIAVPLTALAKSDTQSDLQSIVALADPDVGAAYAMFAATDQNPPQTTVPSHIEFLIDRQGYLRARWLAVAADSARQTRAILDQVAILSTEAPHPLAPDGHLH